MSLSKLYAVTTTPKYIKPARMTLSVRTVIRVDPVGKYFSTYSR